MRKLSILLAAAALAATSSGCTGCFGRCRNFFHRGSPCGTAVAPAVLGAPLAMGTPISQPAPAPMMTAPIMTGPMVSAPMVMGSTVCCDPCVPCNPCCDPCSGGAVSGYGEACCDGGMMSTPASGTYLQSAPTTPMQITPGPVAEPQ